nr:hypothetical protein [Tanacetum cinerariifolium]
KGGDAVGSGMGRIEGDAGSGGDGICGNRDDNGVSGDDSGMYPGESVVGEAAAGSGCSSAGKTSSSTSIYSGYSGSGT